MQQYLSQMLSQSLTISSFVVSILSSMFFLSSSLTHRTLAQCADETGVILVTNTDDEGDGSLRAAIECANETPGPNRIEFDIPDDAIQRIFVGSTTGEPLPNLNDAGTVIDATTQVGFGQVNDFPRIVLDGSQNDWQGPYNAILILANNCEIYGLEIINFPDDGIDVYEADSVVIGAAGKGNILYNNGSEQDIFPNFAGSWNGCAIVLRRGANNCKVQGNIIGLDRNQRGRLGNEYCGILNRSNANNNLIGGDAPGEANIIAYNAVGIRVDNSVGVRIQRNEMYCNDTVAIQLIRNANLFKSPPIITQATLDGISGTAQPNDEIEVFLADRNCENTPCHGRELLGVTTADAQGNWSLVANAEDVTDFEGENVTATATDSQQNTSAFATCRGIVDTEACVDSQGFIYVINTADEGQGSLRAAIDCANSSPGDNVIRFNIPGRGPHRIYVGETSDEKLPALTDPGTTIDGASHPDYGLNNNFQPQIVLDGSRKEWRTASNAIWVRADETKIYALEIVNFPDDGIDITRANFCQIGDINRGNVIYNVGSEQDFFPETSGGPWEGCAIVIKLGSSNNVVQGNYLGTNYQQTIDGGVEYCGVIIRDGGDNNIIGGRQLEEGNVIAYNAGGVLVRQNAFSTRIQNNRFYCNDTLAIALTGNANNAHPAPFISQATAETITGTAAANDIIELYISNNTDCEDAVCQGSTLLGRVSVGGNGTWTINAPFFSLLEEGDIVTAIGIDVLGNTSSFATCTEVSAQPECTMSAVAINVQDASCGLNNGSFSISPRNGSFPFFFDIGEGSSFENQFENLGAGTYSVTVTDRNECVAVVSVVLTESNTPMPFVSEVQDATCNAANGSVVVAAQGGRLPLRFDIGFGQQNDGNFNNLLSGNYTVTITDASNCSATQSVVIGGTTPPTAAVTERSNATCEDGETTASFRVSATNGTPPYLFDIGDGQTTNSFFGGLSTGAYTVTVTDANNCITEVSTNVTASSPPDADVATVTDASCGGQDGSFSLFVRNNTGTPPYTFSIGEQSNQTGDFTNLAPDTYTITITDANGCQDIEGITIGANVPPTAGINNVEEATCGNNNGSFTVNVQGGTPPYRYDLGTGNSDSNAFVNLSAGTYVVTITDANGCEDIQGVEIADAPAPLLTIVSIVPASCNGSDGSFRINANNGTPPYTFDIGEGIQNNGQFNNLAAGVYQTEVIDANGCSSNINVQIAGGTPPTVRLTSVSEASCGQSNGSFVLSIDGGTSPYTLNYGSGEISGNTATNVSAGSYDVTITDANGCSATQQVEVTETANPTVRLTSVSEASCGQSNGSFVLSIDGGTSPYTLNYGSGEISGNTATNVSAGSYDVTITDANGCSATQQVEVTETANPTASVENIQAANCGDNDGAFTVNVTGGTAPYTFDIGEGTVDNGTFTGLAEDDYVVTVTDANNCTTTQFVSINSSNGLQTAISSIKPPSCGESDGSFRVEVGNGQPPFSYDIGQGPVDNPNFTNLSPGNYNVTITDASNCMSVEQISFENTGIVPVAQFTFVREDLTIRITNNSQAATFNSWTFGDGNGSEAYNPSHTYATEGQYTICLNVANECGSDFICSELNMGGTTDPKANITGEIEQEDGQPINFVEVRMTNLQATMTGEDGGYSFNDLPANNDTYTITPYKNINYANGITTFDLFLINNHILDINRLPSPYKQIAADVNNSGSITTFDIVLLRKIILGIEDDFSRYNTSWRFVPASYEWQDPDNIFSEDYPESLTVNLNSNLSLQDFIGVKIGDVNNSALPDEESLQEVENRHSPVAIQLTDRSFEAGETFTVDMQLATDKSIAALQMAVLFDTDYLVPLDIEVGEYKTIAGTPSVAGGIARPKPGQLNSSLLRSEFDASDASLYQLRFRALRSGQLSHRLYLAQTGNLRNLAYHPQGAAYPLILDFDNAVIAAAQIGASFPNPFTDQTTLQFTLPTPETVTIHLFSSTGERLQIVQYEGQAGWNKWEWKFDASQTASGLFYYQIETENALLNGRVLRLRD